MKLKASMMYEPGTGDSGGGGTSDSGSSGAHAAFSDTSGGAVDTGAADGASGGAGGDSSNAGAGGQDASVTGARPSAAPAPALTADDIAKAMVKAGLGGQPATPREPERQYTQEDFDRAFNVFQADEPMIKALLAGGQDALRAVHLLRDGFVKQAVTMAQYIVQQALEDHNKKFSPEFNSVKQYVQEQQIQKLYGQFYEKNADLKPYDSIVKMVVDQMKANKEHFDDWDGAFKALADRVRLTLKNLPNNGNGAGAAAAAGGQTQGSNRMPALSNGGGQSGAGGNRGGNSGPTDKKAAHSVFSR